MKVILCDKCGQLVPDVGNPLIFPIEIKFGKQNEVKTIERDICPDCMEDLVKQLEPFRIEQRRKEPEATASDEPSRRISTTTVLEETAEPSPEPAPEPTPEPVQEQQPEPTPEPAPEPTPEPEPIAEKKEAKPATAIDPDVNPLESGEIECAFCKKPFVPKNKRAVCCSKYCANHKWIEDQKIKKVAASPQAVQQPDKKETTDELLARLKRENPIREAKRPDSLRGV